jgi:L-threonylcarbamoyladenylate synthase
MSPTSSVEIRRAAEIIRRGGLVAFPTETVYGLGANALDAVAVERIYRAKGRPATSPLIVHVSSIDEARQFSAAWPDAAHGLAQHYWPGPLSLVRPCRTLSQPDCPRLRSACPIIPSRWR